MLFGDDSILFTRSTLEEVNLVKTLLPTYERASSQFINLQKSSSAICPNMGPDRTHYTQVTLALGN